MQQQQQDAQLKLLSLSVSSVPVSAPALSINTAAANAAATLDTQEALPQGFSHLATPPPDQDPAHPAAPFGSARLVLAPSPEPSGGDFLYFEKSDPDPTATSAATTAYPSSPPPSRQRDHHPAQAHLSHAPPNHFRLPQQRLALDMLNINSSYPAPTTAPSHNSLLHHQRPPNYPSPSSAISSAAAESRFPPLSTMLAAEHHQQQQQQSANRYARYPFSSPTDDRRLSADMSDSYSKHQQYASPQSLPNSTPSYAAPSYTLHRIARSNSFDDYPKDSSAPHPGRDDRAFDPYSPIQSSFSSSPHASSYLLHHQASRPYTNTATTTTNSSQGNLAYPLYPSAEDMSYDSRPHSSSGESNSPSYAYNHSAAANPGAVGLPPNLDQAYGNPNDASKTYSFVSLPGNTVRKRPRRRYDEIERLYSCNYPGCTKAYGTLNHLNAHVNMQKHGQKRHPNEFKEMRKQWRKMKKEQEQERDRLVMNNGLNGHGHHHHEGGLSSAGGAPPGAGAANPSMSELMRRRRIDGPYGLHHPHGDAGVGVDVAGVSGLSAASVSVSVPTTALSDALGMQTAMDSHTHSAFGMGMASTSSMDAMTGVHGAAASAAASGGYGHHHYVQQHQQEVYRRAAAAAAAGVGPTPVSPVTPISPADTYAGNGNGNNNGNDLSIQPAAPGSIGAYYDSLGVMRHQSHPHQAQGQGQGQMDYDDRTGRTSPTPRNQLSSDATLCSPFSTHPLPGAGSQ